ncbi:MAG TPA: RICIN domain-containing protein [Ideonella sp.]|uniref:RICIN domain-containing protein n=1 Tax=Ideonella sp. TaxID=1929293 RepID=UPI002E37B50B|nr:RICIN domain-containing protein [Ideonella sp.]HEX5682938.1 RICIN domain-containing protein [Ideonella sp.]
MNQSDRTAPVRCGWRHTATRALPAALLAWMGAANAFTPLGDPAAATPRPGVTAPPPTLGHQHVTGIDADHDVQVVYFLPSDAPNRGRGALMLNAARQIQAQWSGWGWTFHLNRGVIKLESSNSCAHFDDFNVLWDETRSKLEARGQYYPNVKYLVFGECTTGGGAAQASMPGNTALFYSYVVDGIGLNDGSPRNLADIGSIGHEMGHNFGLPHENCGGGAGQDTIDELARMGLPTNGSKGPMCNGAYWPNVTPEPYQHDLVKRYGCPWLKGCMAAHPKWVWTGTPGDGTDRGAYFAAQASSKCIDVYYFDHRSNAEVAQYDCVGQANQRVKLKDAGNGLVHLVFGHSGYCLDPMNSSRLVGAKMVQWPCSGDDDTKWKANQVSPGVYEFVNARSGLCLDVPGASPDSGLTLQQWSCNGTPAQRWVKQ